MAATKGKSGSKSKGKKSSSKSKKSTRKKSTPKIKKEDWFEELDAELDKKTEKAKDMDGGTSSKKEKLNKELVSDFWKIVLRFEKISIHFAMEPGYNAFAQFEKYPFEWSLKDNYAYGDLTQILISDKTQSDNRVGDTLKFRHYTQDETGRVRLSFVFCEGEHYYKYSGWKRMFGEYIAYDTTMKSASIDDIHAVLADIVRVWYESHLRRNRDHFLKHLDKNYEKGETYTE